MEIWVQREQGHWRHWTDIGLALDAIASSSQGMVLFIIDSGSSDDEMVASLHLARRLAACPLNILVGSEHPTLRWLEMVRQAGSDRVLLLSLGEKAPHRREPPLEGAVDLDAALCPALHVRRQREATASVCGMMGDRLVLGRHHLDRWCLASKEKCPYWLGGSHGWGFYQDT